VTRAVFDCVILLQAAARRTGPAAECLQAVRDGRLKLFLSPDILAEVRDVLGRPKNGSVQDVIDKAPRSHSRCSWHRDICSQNEGLPSILIASWFPSQQTRGRSIIPSVLVGI
jgi:PIN domain